MGRAIAGEVAAAARALVVVERDEEGLDAVSNPVVVGDTTEDAVLRAAGIERAAALVAAIEGDAAYSFITLSARALKPDLFIVARARSQDSAENQPPGRTLDPRMLTFVSIGRLQTRA